MDTTTIVLSIISVVGTFSSIIFAYLAFHRNSKGDSKQTGKNEGVLISDVGYIKSSLDRIEKQLDKLEEKYDDLHTRIIKVEQKMDDHINNKGIHNLGGK
jgi:peptidoglycan hydrolase CwlO-like protein